MRHKWWLIPLSFVFLFPAHIFMMLFVYLFDSLTGQLGLGYALGCLLFGALAASPVYALIFCCTSWNKGAKVLCSIAVACVYALFLFASCISFNIPQIPVT